MEVLDGIHHEVPDTKPDDEEAGEYYVPGEYDKNSNDDDGGGDRVGDNDIYPLQEPADIDTDDDKDAAIILNPDGSEHDGPILGVTIDQDQNVVDSDTAGDTKDTNPTGVADITGATELIGVATPPKNKTLSRTASITPT